MRVMRGSPPLHSGGEGRDFTSYFSISATTGKMRNEWHTVFNSAHVIDVYANKEEEAL